MAENTLHPRGPTEKASGPSVALIPRVPTGEPTADLLREALDETRDLVRLEVALAREELTSELAAAKRAALAFAAAAVAGMSALAMCLVALALAFADQRLAALIIGAVALGLSITLALVGWKMLPKRPLGETKRRLETELGELKERIV